VTRNYNDQSLQNHLDTPVYLVGDIDDITEQLGSALKEAGTRQHHHLSALEGLPATLSQRQHHVQPALVLVVSDKLDEGFLTRCRQIHPLLEQEHAGLVVVVTAPGLDLLSQMAALKAGCLDVLHTPQRQLPADIATRLQLALRLLHEHHLRVNQEQRFLIELADRRVRDARLNYLANHDELTDLANRASFEMALNKAIAVGRQKQLTHALLYLDLDRFKLHNEAAGHQSGNYLLQQVSNQLRSALPPEYLLARIGADEFAVLLQGTDEREALATAEHLRKIVAAIEPDGKQIVFHVGVSIGIGLFSPGGVHSASQALVQAEQACYLAKTRGGDAVHRFSCEDEELQNLHEDMHWSQPIRQALGENHLFLTYQPILTVSEARISHYEALVRIPKSLGGDDRSARFMLAAERLGLARQIDLWVVDKAIDFLAGNRELSLGVNLSSHAFQEASLLPRLQQKLRNSAIAPERLTFEITETAAITNFSETRHMIARIRDLGCRFALDDFGSGFSSYNYLKEFPIDLLKIDGSFIVGLQQDRRDQIIVQSMIDIAHGLDKEVVAEFIENADTLGILTEMGIDYAQGYYIGKPTLYPEIM
jgi:diguanylate cyclase (GGDEF)-like protein